MIHFDEALQHADMLERENEQLRSAIEDRTIVAATWRDTSNFWYRACKLAQANHAVAVANALK